MQKVARKRKKSKHQPWTINCDMMNRLNLYYNGECVAALWRKKGELNSKLLDTLQSATRSNHAL